MNKRKLINMLEKREITKDELERLNVLNAARYSLLIACNVDPGAALLMPEYSTLTDAENKKLHDVDDEIKDILGSSFLNIYDAVPIANQNIINDKIESYVL